jgi:hypothetical protein
MFLSAAIYRYIEHTSFLGNCLIAGVMLHATCYTVSQVSDLRSQMSVSYTFVICHAKSRKLFILAGQ